MSTALDLKPAVAAALAIWHECVARQDMSRLGEISHPEAVFRSPAAHTPYPSAAALYLILSNVVQVFENFTYHREFASADGLNVVLEFSATVAGRELKGIDMICFDEAGKIREFEVMARPLSGLQALAEAMAQRVGAQLKSMG